MARVGGTSHEVRRYQRSWEGGTDKLCQALEFWGVHIGYGRRIPSVLILQSFTMSWKHFDDFISNHLVHALINIDDSITWQNAKVDQRFSFSRKDVFGAAAFDDRWGGCCAGEGIGDRVSSQLTFKSSAEKPCVSVAHALEERQGFLYKTHHKLNHIQALGKGVGF